MRAVTTAGILIGLLVMGGCGATAEEPVYRQEQAIVKGARVTVELQRSLGLVTVGGGCSGTLLNRFWVLTADHCVTSNAKAGGPSAAMGAVTISAAWTSKVVTPTRFVRSFWAGGRDVSLIFLGGDDLGAVDTQLLFVGTMDDGMTVTKYGRGIDAFARPAEGIFGAIPAHYDGLYRDARFTTSQSGSTTFTLALNAFGQVGNGGDSGGPDVLTAPDGVPLGIAGVQSTCVPTGYVSGKPRTWTWATGISSCTSAAVGDIQFEIVQAIQERPTWKEQLVRRSVDAAPGWTSIVPMNIDGDRFTDYLSYNKETGRAIYSRGLGQSGDQAILKDVTEATGWTSIVPMEMNGDGLTDLLFYNADSGRAVSTVAVGRDGDQATVRTVDAAPGWTSIVPLEINGDGLTDLLSYNKDTGLAISSVASDRAGGQAIVKQVDAAVGWTSIVPMDINGDGLTDLLSYSADSGLAIYSVARGRAGDQAIVKQVNAAPGWTSIVPMNMDGERGTDLLSYNKTSGLAVYSVATTSAGDQAIVKTVEAAPGWTAVVPMEIDGDGFTDLLSYNAESGLAVYSVGVAR